MTWALDLDGVVWLAGRAIPGSAQAVSELRSAGERVVFLTNNSGPLVEGHVEALAKVGVNCAPEDVATSAQAAASMLSPGSRVAVVGDKGILEALDAQGVKVVSAKENPEAVVVGRSLELDYWALAGAAGAVRDGARFIATNTDSTFPTGDGLLPGAGALVAFIATAAGRKPEVAGKPEDPMAALVKSRYGTLSVVAGDRPETDGLFAQRTGSRFGLVFSGVTQPSDLPVDPTPDLVARDLAELVKKYLGR
ncbi:MAG: HAD-IIA family hydrolase [Acidimicrobiales bacterium]|jgi:4-nitrophenyl phosphatase